MVLELLKADAPTSQVARCNHCRPGTISAPNIPYSSIVFDLHQVTEIQTGTPRRQRYRMEQIKHATWSAFYLPEIVCV